MWVPEPRDRFAPAVVSSLEMHSTPGHMQSALWELFYQSGVQSAPRLRQSMSGQIDVERLPDDGNIDLIRTDWRGGETQISQGDPGMLINDLGKRYQVSVYNP